MKLRLIFVVMMLALAGLVSADQQGNLPIEGVIGGEALRMVSGGLCTDLPDDKGTPTKSDFQVWCSGANGVTDDMTGCVAQFHDSMGRLLKEVELKPGEASISAPAGTASWQRFNCYEVKYTCENFVSEGCGESGDYAQCADNEMFRVRDCSDNTPASVETERCIPWYECYYERCEPETSAWSVCSEGTQYRTVQTADCQTWNEEQSCSVGKFCTLPNGLIGDIQTIENNQYICTEDNNRIGGWKLLPEGQSTPSPNAPSPGENGDLGKGASSSADLTASGMTVFYDPSLQAVVGRVTITNEGENMLDTYLLEMQVLPEGDRPFAFISTQKTCDPNHPENVHKNFLLKAGESKEIELRVSRDHLPEGDYSVSFLTRHKCYATLTEAELENYDEFQKVGPFPGYEHAGDIYVGSQVAKAVSGFAKALPWLFMVVGFILLFVAPMVGLPVFVLGVIIWLVQALFM